MIKVIKIIMVILTIIIMFVICSTGHNYERQARVTDVWNDTIECIDEQGNLWSFCGDGYKKDDNIILIMSDNETIGITDDVILNVK